MFAHQPGANDIIIFVTVFTIFVIVFTIVVIVFIIFVTINSFV